MFSTVNLKRAVALGWLALAALLSAAGTTRAAEPVAATPRLVTTDGATQLIVDGAPFMIFGGELGNSSASSAAYMKPIWPKLQALHLNTVLAPVYWELIEPQPGKFDFTSVDELLASAREHQLKLVLLWFGSWKNSMSSYAPSWIKRDLEGHPRALSDTGEPQEILSAFSERNLAADRAAFETLMRHLREHDSRTHTVIMIQVENEIGMLPSAREHGPQASQAFAGPVPGKLLEYLAANEALLDPQLKQAWLDRGRRMSGSWTEVFGDNIATEEYFTAWHYARYTDAVTSAGKAIHPLPMFVNAALNYRPGAEPGQYPSGGPLPHLMDIWKAGAPTIDLLTPDFYNPDFKLWNDRYTRQGDALFIPEHRFDASVGAKALYCFGHYNCLGFSPFSIESTATPSQESIAKSYGLLRQIEQFLPRYQGTPDIDAVLLDRTESKAELTLGDYRLTFHHDHTLRWSAGWEADEWPHAAALVIRTGPEDYLVAGTGVVATFTPADGRGRAGIDQMYEGQFVEGRWQPGRSMNGDQSHQGRHLRIPVGEWSIQQVRLYRY